MTFQLPPIIRLVLPCLLALAFIAPASAQDIEESGRAHIYEFLNVTVNPRAAAMGNSFVAMKNDVSTIFSNPAALSTMSADSSGRDQVVSAGFTKHILDINEGYVAYGMPVKEGAPDRVAAAIQYIDYGTFKGANGVGELTDDFGAREFALTLAYSGIVRDGIRYGAAFKFITSALVTGSSVEESRTSSGIAFDLGAFYEYEPLLMTFGLSAMNIGHQLSTYAGLRESLPFNLQFGISKKLERLPLTLHLNFHNLSRDREGRGLFFALNNFSVGGEFVLGKVVRLRFGYDNQLRRDLKVPRGSGIAGFSGGFGLAFKQYTFDYALSDNGYAFQSLHRIGGSMAF
jgi:hypothetical protein